MTHTNHPLRHWERTCEACQREAAAYDEGTVAGTKGHHFSTDCPYTYDKFEVTPHEFHAAIKPMLDAWFEGWCSTTQLFKAGHKRQSDAGARVLQYKESGERAPTGDAK